MGTRLINRRDLLQFIAAVGSGVWATTANTVLAVPRSCPLFQLALSEYSLHRTIAKRELDPLNFAAYSADKFGLRAVQYWNRPFFDKATDSGYIEELRRRAFDSGVKSLLILVDCEGNLGDPDTGRRRQAVDRHRKWVVAAQHLGCHSIRVHARSEGSEEEQKKLIVDGLQQLCEFAAKHHIGVLVENHGGLSSNGQWLASVMQTVNMPNCGTLPDFGNFHTYDRYQGVRELMPWARAISAKSHDFDDAGQEIHTNYAQIMQIVVDAAYCGHVSIEYAGNQLSEDEGIFATKRLLEQVRDQLS